jgi:hypothetical protein
LNEKIIVGEATDRRPDIRKNAVQLILSSILVVEAVCNLVLRLSFSWAGFKSSL